MIGDEGCVHLAKAQWPKLKDIYLSYYSIHIDGNQIKRDGIQILSKADWPLLLEIILCTSWIVQLISVELH